MEDAKFVCGACEKSSEQKDAMTECRVCRRIHCSDCVDEYGRCVACAEKGS